MSFSLNKHYRANFSESNHLDPEIFRGKHINGKRLEDVLEVKKLVKEYCGALVPFASICYEVGTSFIYSNTNLSSSLIRFQPSVQLIIKYIKFAWTFEF